MVTVPRRKPQVTPFARALRGLMETHGWTNRQAAEALGVSHTQIGRYLSGSEPSISRAALMAQTFGISLDELAAIGPPPDRSLELAEMAVAVRGFAIGQAGIANELQRVAEQLSRLGGQAEDTAATG